MKKCSKCQQSLPESSFHRCMDGLFGMCKPCEAIYAKNYRTQNADSVKIWYQRYKDKNPDRDRIYRWKKNGVKITIDEYNTLFISQDGKCAICKSASVNSRCKNLFVDHDHDTGAIRGLLCHKCNSMIGYANNSKGILQSALNYLAKDLAHETNFVS